MKIPCHKPQGADARQQLQANKCNFTFLWRGCALSNSNKTSAPSDLVKKRFCTNKKSFYILSIDMYISYNIQKQMYISHKRGLKIFSFCVCLTLRRLLFVFKHIPYTCAHIFATVSRQRQISQCTLYGRAHLRPHLCICLPINNTSCNFVLVYMQTINL